MKVLLITYQLKEKPKEQYSELYLALQNPSGWWHYLENTWLIYTNESPKDWYNKLSSKIGKGDYILIIEVTSNYWGVLKKEGWDWLQKAFNPDKK